MTRSASAAAARPAAFDRAAQHRRSMIGKINIAKAQLRMVEDDYRQLLFAETGKISLTQCSEPQLALMLDALKRKGFRPMAGGRKGIAMHSMARKARALWISLYQLGVVHNPAEEALEAFATRQIGCDKLIWARQSDANKLIEALKDMGRRAGWRMNHIGTHKPYSPIELQASLCHAILARLKAAKIAPADWGLHDAALKLCGIENGKAERWSAEDYQQLAGGLGDILRRAGGAS